MRKRLSPVDFRDTTFGRRYNAKPPDPTRSWRWQKLRKTILARDGYRCMINLDGCLHRATEVDHIMPHSEGGEFWEPMNLQAACQPCNRRKGVTLPSQRRVAHGSVVRIVGQPGAGKSYLREALAKRLGVQSFDIAAMPGHLSGSEKAWDELARRMGVESIVESAGTSIYEEGFWVGAATLTVRVSAPETVRVARLQRRGVSLRPLLAVPQAPDGDVEWDGDLEALAAKCASFFRSRNTLGDPLGNTSPQSRWDALDAGAYRRDGDSRR